MIPKPVAALLSVFRAIRFILWCPNRQRNCLHDKSAEGDSEVQSGQLKRFCLQELQVATNHFSKKNTVGRGHYGKVYKGQLANGMLVAVKKLREVNSDSMKQFQEEVDMIINIGSHQNLLQPIGFCMTVTERLLVYPFMVNGGVGSYLRECSRSRSRPPLDWPFRMRIAQGCAQGLLFLHVHCDPKIIHRNVRSYNIFLNDQRSEVVLGNFCTAMRMNYKDDHVKIDVRRITKNMGYNAPENVSSGKFSEKSDVFGYGITLLELITGQMELACEWLVYDDYVSLLDKVKGFVKKKRLDELVDPNLQNNYVKAEVESLIQIALLCTQESPDDRPKMPEVVRMLQGNGLAEKWEKFQSLELIQ